MAILQECLYHQNALIFKSHQQSERRAKPFAMLRMKVTVTGHAGEVVYNTTSPFVEEWIRRSGRAVEVLKIWSFFFFLFLSFSIIFLFFLSFSCFLFFYFFLVSFCGLCWLWAARSWLGPVVLLVCKEWSNSWGHNNYEWPFFGFGTKLLRIITILPRSNEQPNCDLLALCDYPQCLVAQMFSSFLWECNCDQDHSQSPLVSGFCGLSLIIVHD